MHIRRDGEVKAVHCCFELNGLRDTSASIASITEIVQDKNCQGGTAAERH